MLPPHAALKGAPAFWTVRFGEPLIGSLESHGALPPAPSQSRLLQIDTARH